MTDTNDNRLRQLERTNRWLVLGLAVLIVLQTWSILRPATPAGEGMLLLPKADAATMQTFDNAAKKPKLVLTTSTSGATLWVYELQKDGRYARAGFGQ